MLFIIEQFEFKMNNGGIKFLLTVHKKNTEAKIEGGENRYKIIHLKLLSTINWNNEGFKL